MTSIETADVAIGERANLADTLLAIIPTNPLHALASGDMLSIILFALFVGVILAGLGESGEDVYKRQPWKTLPDAWRNILRRRKWNWSSRTGAVPCIQDISIPMTQ